MTVMICRIPAIFFICVNTAADGNDRHGRRALPAAPDDFLSTVALPRIIRPYPEISPCHIARPLSFIFLLVSVYRPHSLNSLIPVTFLQELFIVKGWNGRADAEEYISCHSSQAE
ncbi:hypothetical protein GTPT_0773 [Tatumella ptyseos ATCC 33301]|uniref:Uncharacterized protein n=1 Tax=Tatumella ptyseos ATCC 33301 TaxID=1005995 RepID=A0A085JMH8_9GAMM|nr:hypothetical protein GTPT_0773 [Tatumella ptyseos ATCC 33301]